MRLLVRSLTVLAMVLALAGCDRSLFQPPTVEGKAAMIDDAGQPRLWVLSKQEEQRQKNFGGGRASAINWHTDTYFHIAVQAIDPVSTKTLWKQNLRTFGGPSRASGSNVSAKLLGQEGARVWLLIGDEPMAVSAHDGRVLIDGPGIEMHNPALKGLLPSEAKHYGFDNGLVLMSADARKFVVRGDKFEALAYEPPPAAGPVEATNANGMPEIAPMMPVGDASPRSATLGGQWIGLYSDKEAAYIEDDHWGKTLKYPYSVTDEGSLARRTFWRATIGTEERLTNLTKIPGAPVFLKGRFVVTTPGSEEPDPLEGASGLLVLHATRMDDAGRIALDRVDENLKSVWSVELPFSETGPLRHVYKWRVPGHLVAVGIKEFTDDGGVLHRQDWLASVALDTGAMQSRPLVSSKD